MQINDKRNLNSFSFLNQKANNRKAEKAYVDIYQGDLWMQTNGKEEKYRIFNSTFNNCTRKVIHPF